MGRILDEPVLVIGIGNVDRGDDGVGNFTLECLCTRVPTCVKTTQHSGEGTSLIDLWQTNDTPTVYIIDAMDSGLPAGSIRCFEVHEKPLPSYFGQHNSTHAFGLAEAVELARSLGCLPQKLIVYGIEGQCFDFGAPLSSEVESAARRVTELILNELADLAEIDTAILPRRTEFENIVGHDSR